MVKLSLIFCVVLSAMFALCKNSNLSTDAPASKKEMSKNYRLVFYNVENLFDIRDDEGKNDAEFLPDSDIHWNSQLYEKKLNNITKVIQALGDSEELPELIALSEVENRSVLEDLIEN